MNLDLRAGPASAQPPLPFAIAIVAVGLLAPAVYLRAGTPSLFLGIAALAVPVAGAIALADALAARRRVARDPSVRTRARIGTEGITLFAVAGEPQFHPWPAIADARLTSHALVIRLKTGAQHAVRFGRLETDPASIRSALAARLPR